MVRIVKDYDERFSEFLDVAQSLFFSKGYEQTSVQDIINSMGVAKGTFYHYFDTKVDLLDAVVKRNRERVLSAVTPIVVDNMLEPIAKFERFFSEINNWKLLNHTMILRMLRMLYQDENALLRLKLFAETRQTVAAPLTTVIEQGRTAGMFHVEFAYETAELILRMVEMPSHTFVSVLLKGQYDDADMDAIQREIHVFNRSVERVLGVSENTFSLIKSEDLSAWLSILNEESVHEK